MDLLHIIFVLAALASAVPDHPRQHEVLFGLPVAPGGPGIGPWEIAVWPFAGCKNCIESSADISLYQQTSTALLSGDTSKIDISETKVYVLSNRPRSPADQTMATFSDLHQRITNCKIGSHGILERAKKGPVGVSYGIGLDCPDNAKREWLSINFAAGRLKYVYFLPGENIQVIKG